MLEVTINVGAVMHLNPDHIVSVARQSMDRCVVVMTNGREYIVHEPQLRLVERIGQEQGYRVAREADITKRATQ